MRRCKETPIKKSPLFRPTFETHPNLLHTSNARRRRKSQVTARRFRIFRLDDWRQLLVSSASTAVAVLEMGM